LTRLPESVAIIGGGIIGAAAAYHLARCGLAVTVIEKDRFGQGSSWGNCGIVLPSHVLPLNSVENLVRGLRWMFKKDAPLHISPRWDPALWRWLLDFSRRCNGRNNHRSSLAISAITQGAVARFDAWIDTEHLQCRWRKDGALFLFRSEEAFRHYAKTDAATRRYGHGCSPLSRAELAKREPSVAEAVAGAWLDAGAARLRPHELMQELHRVLKRIGVTIREATEFIGFHEHSGRAVCARTSRGEVSADAFVVAAGAWTPMLSAALGVNLPIQPGKGYSATFSGGWNIPSIPCFFEERQVVFTPWAGGCRLGGTMEFSGYDDRLNRARIDALTAAASEYLATRNLGRLEEEWYGWRPMTSDGVPIIDRVPSMENVVVAAGHNMLGITMAPATGRLVADLITGRPPHIDPTPYRLARF
jgi:D-amino-acid dehydrogenase